MARYVQQYMKQGAHILLWRSHGKSRCGMELNRMRDGKLLSHSVCQLSEELTRLPLHTQLLPPIAKNKQLQQTLGKQQAAGSNPLSAS